MNPTHFTLIRRIIATIALIWGIGRSRQLWTATPPSHQHVILVVEQPQSINDLTRLSQIQTSIMTLSGNTQRLPLGIWISGDPGRLITTPTRDYAHVARQLDDLPRRSVDTTKTSEQSFIHEQLPDSYLIVVDETTDTRDTDGRKKELTAAVVMPDTQRETQWYQRWWLFVVVLLV